MEPIIRIENLKKQYGDKIAVAIDHLEVARGEGFGLVGNNGAGKTTLFRSLLDLLRPTSGAVYSKGTDVSRSEEWKKYIGSYLDEGFLIDFLTPDEYFNFIGSINGLNRSEVEERLSRFHELFHGEILDQGKYIRDLSRGNQKKVGVAAALLPDPEVLVLDEPFANLDPTTQIRLKRLLRDEQEQRQLTMLISSHDLNHVTEVCERIVVLEKGLVMRDTRTSERTLQELEDYFAGIRTEEPAP